MQSRFTMKAGEALANARESAKELGHGYIGTEHILIGLVQMDDSLAGKVLNNNGVTEENLVSLVLQLIAPESNILVKDIRGYTPRANRLLDAAIGEAARFKSDLVGTEHILIAMIKETECLGTRLLNTIGVSIKKVYLELLTAMGEDAGAYKEDFRNGKVKAKDKNSMQTLGQYSRDLTKLARQNKLDPVIGRDEEIQRVIQILSRRTKNNPCLVGEPGVGKTAIVEGLAARIARGDVPETIKDKRVLTLDLSGMVAGSKYRGEFEERIKRVIAEVISAGNILLFLDEIHTIIGAGGAEGAIDAANILKPSLARGEVQLIGATTMEEYRKHIEKDAALERRLQPVRVEEPSVEETVEILKGLRDRYEKHHDVTITDEALYSAAKLAGRYINDRYLPDKAIDIVDEACSRKSLDLYAMPDEVKKLEEEISALSRMKEDAICKEDFEKASAIKVKESKKKDKLSKIIYEWEGSETYDDVVDEDTIADVVAMWTKIPVQKIAEAESEKLLKLEETLHNRVVGQDEAVSAVAKAVRRGRVGLKDPKRPIGSFLFLGPTGVGKTELSKALADAMFGTEKSLIRVDMSEFMEKHTVSKLIGSPPGYVGYDEGGQLSEKVRRNPYAVVLFDEVEKAHPDVFNVLLQVLDDGRITDSTGRVVDFKNTVIIMTSNAGAENIIAPKTMGFVSDNDEKREHESMKSKVMDEVKRVFKPEFINRIDEITVFHVLNKEQIAKIVDIMIATINKRIMEQMKLSIELDEEARKYIVDKGYDAKYGARPLKRTIQNEIEDVLAEKVLEGSIVKGNRVMVTLKDGKLIFTNKRGKNK